MERTTTLWVWFILMIFLGISIDGCLSQGQQHLMKKTRSSAVVVGTVYCDTCFNSAFSKTPNHLIPGALVAVECIGDNSKPSFKQEVKTDERGEFKVKLPFSVSKHVKNIKRCSVKLLKSSQPYCSIASSATSSSFKRLKSSNHGENARVFSAGFFTFKPENQPEICRPQKLGSLHNKKSDTLDDKKTEVRKPDFFFPPNPLNPPSVIPPNPLIPSIPTPTLPPNPVIPSPPSLPPLPFQPPPSPLLPPIPAVPGIPTLPPVPVVNPPSLPPPSSPIPAIPGIPTLPPSLPTPVPAVPGIPALPPAPVVNPPSPPHSSSPIPFPPLIPGTPPASPSFSNHHQP
ncbi:Major pollen allergen Lol p 11 [Cardamine amara subsp. amara]|uniref:Major pollen allergen Lol p 11 n=1 Tax=Cardamine amara subsp. amara TaxID=228776 RepID=A0ABD1AGJ1_CARAN